MQRTFDQIRGMRRTMKSQMADTEFWALTQMSIAVLAEDIRAEESRISRVNIHTNTDIGTVSNKCPNKGRNLRRTWSFGWGSLFELIKALELDFLVTRGPNRPLLGLYLRKIAEVTAQIDFGSMKAELIQKVTSDASFSWFRNSQTRATPTRHRLFGRPKVYLYNERTNEVG